MDNIIRYMTKIKELEESCKYCDNQKKRKERRAVINRFQGLIESLKNPSVYMMIENFNDETFKDPQMTMTDIDKPMIIEVEK